MFLQELVDYFLEKGADIHAKCYNGWNAVMGAVYWNEYGRQQRSKRGGW